MSNNHIAQSVAPAQADSYPIRSIQPRKKTTMARKKEDLKPGVGKRIYEARRLKRMSQTDLGRESGVAQIKISRAESNDPPSMRANDLFAIADILEVNPRWLLLGEGPTETVAQQAKPKPGCMITELNGDEMMWLTLYRNMSEEQRDKAKAMLYVLNNGTH